MTASESAARCHWSPFRSAIHHTRTWQPATRHASVLRESGKGGRRRARSTAHWSRSCGSRRASNSASKRRRRAPASSYLDGLLTRDVRASVGRSCWRGHRPNGPGRNDSVGSVVLARSACATPSSFARYGPRTGPRLAHSSACTSICFAIPSLPNESVRLSLNDSVGSVVLARSACANPSSFARYGSRTGPRLAHSSACTSICFAIPSLPNESVRLSRMLGHPAHAGRLAHSPACGSWCGAIASVGVESFRIREQKGPAEGPG